MAHKPRRLPKLLRSVILPVGGLLVADDYLDTLKQMTSLNVIGTLR